MEGVEDIPGAALDEGLNWSWESFGEYLDALDARPRDMDLGAQLPHGALRVFVMGERARQARRGDAGRGGADARADRRGDARRRDRLLDLAHAQPSHGEGRPDAVAARVRGRAAGHRARHEGCRDGRDRVHLRFQHARSRERIRDDRPPAHRERPAVLGLAGAGPSPARRLAAARWAWSKGWRPRATRPRRR